MEIQVVETIHSNYVAKSAARDNDLLIWFAETMWQRASFPDIAHAIQSICDDFHLLAISAAKLEHFFLARDQIGDELLRSFVRTELEYLITVARSVFDLLQEVVAGLWNRHTRLIDPENDKVRKRNRLHDTRFTKAVFKAQKIPKTAAELVEKYALPPALAEQYEKLAPFYETLLEARDKIVHFGKTVDMIFVTEKGFCVDPKLKPFSEFAWKPEHYFNETIVSLLPWFAHIVIGTIDACNSLLGSYARAIPLLPPIAPGYRVFIRDPANDALIRLWKISNGEAVFWSDLALAPYNS